MCLINLDQWFWGTKFSNLILFLVLQFFFLGNEDATDIIWYHTKSKLIYHVVEWNPTDPPHNKDPTYSEGGSDPPLWQPPFFLLYGELHFMDQRVFARREAAHTISSRSSRMPAGFQPISILDIRPPPEVKNHATWAKLTLSREASMIGHPSSGDIL